jgi:hypothetical protein
VNTRPAAELLPWLAWHSPDGDEATPGLLTTVLFVVSALVSLVNAMSGFASGDAGRAAFLGPAVVLLLASVAKWSGATWVLWVRLAACTCGSLVWAILLPVERPSEPLAVIIIAAFAVACGWRGFSLVSRPELWRTAPPENGAVQGGWIEDISPARASR